MVVSQAIGYGLHFFLNAVSLLSDGNLIAGLITGTAGLYDEPFAFPYLYRTFVVAPALAWITKRLMPRFADLPSWLGAFFTFSGFLSTIL